MVVGQPAFAFQSTLAPTANDKTLEGAKTALHARLEEACKTNPNGKLQWDTMKYTMVEQNLKAGHPANDTYSVTGEILCTY